MIIWFFILFSKEDKSRVEVLKQYSRKNKESVWTPFLHLLDRTDKFIVNQVCITSIFSLFPMATKYDK